MKLSSLDGWVITIKYDQKTARKCYESNLKSRRGTYSIIVQKGEPKELMQAEVASKRRPGTVGEVQEKEIGGMKFKLGTSICQELQDKIVEVISKHMDVFAWSSLDMLRIDPYFLCHRLTMDKKVRPVVQRRRKFNEERRLIIREETHKLLNAHHIREIQYPKWLANAVLVQKANGKWRMCVDFTNLNKAYPKDSYSLSSIDSLVDSASGYGLLSFLDAFSGYNQICMHP